MVLQADGDGDIIRGSPKKAKPNKIPQRGLGIAALEKLRREEQQRRIAGSSFSADENIISAASTSSYGDNSVAGAIFDSLQKPCFFGNFPLLRPPWDPNSRLPLPIRKPPEQHHQVMKNFLSSPSSSGACIQMEPPSNQSYLSINPPLMLDKNKSANLKRSWPFQTGTTRPFVITPGYHGSPPTFRNDEFFFSLPRDDASCSSSSGVPKLDGGLLSLSLFPNSEPTISSQKHSIQVQKNTEEKISEAAGAPTLYNFMGLPHDLIESNPDPEIKGESEYRSL